MEYATWIYTALLFWTSAGDLPLAPAEKTGTLEGQVINRTHGGALVADAEVVLRIRSGSRSGVVATTMTDRYGTFRFEDLPLGTEWVYLPGASHGTVHYTGPRVTLTGARPHVRVEIAVYEEVAEPNPLVISQHNIRIRPHAGILQVTEALVVENSSLACYVGQPDAEGDTVTLRLAIPHGTERVTFDKEFFGRRFKIDGAQLTSSIPWPPGRREIRFQYALRAAGGDVDWSQRRDLPCSHLRLSIHTDEPNQVHSNLKLVKRNAGEVVFQNAGTLRPGDQVRLNLSATGVPLAVYGRWISLVTLVALVVGTSTLLVLRRHRTA